MSTSTVVAGMLLTAVMHNHIRMDYFDEVLSFPHPECKRIPQALPAVYAFSSIRLYYPTSPSQGGLNSISSSASIVAVVGLSESKPCIA